MLRIGSEESRSVTVQLVLCVLTLALVFAGCQQPQPQQQPEVVLAVGPDAAATSIPSEFAARAIEAAGGLDAWMKTKEVRLASVVTLYQPDGSFYLSEQTYEVYPWSNSIQVLAAEPEGASLWRLSNGQLEALEGSGRIAEMPNEVLSRDLAEAVLSIVTAPARLLDNSAQFTLKGSPVKVQGQWHQAIERTPKSGILSGPRLSEAVFYQNTDSSLVDILQFSSAATGKTLTVRGYDYDEILKGGPLVPARIEIFTTDAQGNAQNRLIKIDSHTLGPAK
ncbi:MAG: hypothetical protein ACYSWQ_24375 [Planctomycetota bacterium]|jgi:hypothetical protein